MKKYGMADVMIAVIRAYLETHLQDVPEEQRQEIEAQCCREILLHYPAAQDLEVGR